MSYDFTNAVFNNSFFDPTIEVKDSSLVLVCSDLHFGTKSKAIKSQRAGTSWEPMDLSQEMVDDFERVIKLQAHGYQIICLGDIGSPIKLDGTPIDFGEKGCMFSLTGNHVDQRLVDTNITWIPDGTKLVIRDIDMTKVGELILSHRPYVDKFRKEYNLCGHCHGTMGLYPVDRSIDLSVENAIRYNGGSWLWDLRDVIAMIS